jgi:hypothetical protein
MGTTDEGAGHSGAGEVSGDPVVDAVRAKLAARSVAGQRKYGTTMARTDLSYLDWLRHAQEELLDGAVYLERLIQDLVAEKTGGV